MDFFERQDQARGKTAKLVVYFILAVAGIIASLYFVLTLIWAYFTRKQQAGFVVDWWDPQFLIWIGLGTILVVGFASLQKILSLRDGGSVVARSLGGYKVQSFTQEGQERMLLNVVEEMAIASGMPVPEVYILPEEGINAFAAGFGLDDAAVAVSQGCLDKLSRDELQGVVAHEFSHILNGDMRLNIKLMGVIYGILMLSVIGGGILRAFRHVRVRGSSRSGKGGGGGAIIAAVFFTGMALYAIGYIGVFFGRLIQSAVSRQREFLADASAVQFTRNPEGIAGALKRIGTEYPGALIADTHAQELAHFFFANALKSRFGGAFSTHPPLKARILAIDPQWDGKFPKVKRTAIKYQKAKPIREKASFPLNRKKPPLLDPVEMVFAVGTLSSGALEQARETRESLQEAFGHILSSPLEARALIFALVLDANESRRQKQLAFLKAEAGEELLQVTESLHPRLADRERTDHLPLIELALPSLNQLEPAARLGFLKRLQRLVEMDEEVSPFEFVVQRLVRCHLENHARPKHPGQYIWSTSVLAKAGSRLLSALVYLHTQESAKAYQRFHAAASVWKPFADQLELIPEEQLTYQQLDKALDDLARGSFGLRKQMLRICAAAIQDDGKISVDEAELFRVLSISMECPMPPPKPMD